MDERFNWWRVVATTSSTTCGDQLSDGVTTRDGLDHAWSADRGDPGPKAMIINE